VLVDSTLGLDSRLCTGTDKAAYKGVCVCNESEITVLSAYAIFHEKMGNPNLQRYPLTDHRGQRTLCVFLVNIVHSVEKWIAVYAR